MKKDLIKNIIIVVLILIILGLIAIYLLNPDYNTESTNMIQSAFECQINLSEYIGKMRSDTFDAYSTEQILVGSYNLEDIENSIIMNTAGEEVKSIVYYSPEDIKIVDEIKYYRVNVTNFSSLLNVQLINDTNIVWYVSDTGVLKATYSIKPDWWIDEFEVFHLN